MLPPDRSHLSTEQRHAGSHNLHTLSIHDLVTIINKDNVTVTAALDSATPALAQLLSTIEADFIAGGRVIYVGAGTSGRLGVLDASEAPPTFHVSPDRFIGIIAGGDSALRVSSEGKEDEEHGAESALAALQLTHRDTVIGIAAGGTTPYALGATRIAKNTGSHTAFITCVSINKPATVDHLITLLTGPEILTGSTRMKAATATKLALNTISTALMVRAGKVYGNLMVDVRATNDKLRDRAARIIASLTQLDRAACFIFLDAANGSVKTAVVMHRRQCDRVTAEQILESCNGRLDTILG